MRFAPHGSGTRLDYVIEFDAKVPLTGPLLEKTIAGNVRQGLKDVETRA